MIEQLLSNNIIYSTIVYQISCLFKEYVFEPFIDFFSTYLKTYAKLFYIKLFGNDIHFISNEGQALYLYCKYNQHIMRKIKIDSYGRSSIDDYMYQLLISLNYYSKSKQNHNYITTFVKDKKDYYSLFQEKNSKSIEISTMYSISGCRDTFNLHLLSEMNIPKILKPFQNGIVSQAKTFFNKNNKCTILLSGKSGVGKSTVGYMIAQELYSNVLSYNSCSLEDYDKLYTMFCVPGHPLVVIINEVETFLEKTNTLAKLMNLEKNKSEPCIRKPVWNDFFDKIQTNNYPGIIFFITSNIDIKILETEFPAMFNNVRINIKYQI